MQNIQHGEPSGASGLTGLYQSPTDTGFFRPISMLISILESSKKYDNYVLAQFLQGFLKFA